MSALDKFSAPVQLPISSVGHFVNNGFIVSITSKCIPNEFEEGIGSVGFISTSLKTVIL